jgi:hypothetical protein
MGHVFCRRLADGDRGSASGTARRFSSIHIIYKDKDGNQQTVRAQEGDNLLDLAHANNIELEGA